ncbi:MAG: hypothetical protein NT001_04305 [Candidatus Woesearchaeota archaeon]|nr:hypothetical protein [Candidatus Woesearchaeota archaeon]
MDSILNGQDIDKNVSDAEKTLRKYANFAQSTQDFLRTRPGSRFLEETLEYADLPHIGHYQGNRRVEGAYRVIAFQQNGHSSSKKKTLQKLKWLRK